MLKRLEVNKTVCKRDTHCSVSFQCSVTQMACSVHSHGPLNLDPSVAQEEGVLACHRNCSVQHSALRTVHPGKSIAGKREEFTGHMLLHIISDYQHSAARFRVFRYQNTPHFIHNYHFKSSLHRIHRSLTIICSTSEHLVCSCLVALAFIHEHSDNTYVVLLYSSH